MFFHHKNVKYLQFYTSYQSKRVMKVTKLVCYEILKPYLVLLSDRKYLPNFKSWAVTPDILAVTIS